MLGRTDKLAWSFTNTNPDVQDIYIEKIDSKNPGMYLGPDGVLPFKVRQEIIDIKGTSPLHFIVKETRHGPVVSDSYARARKIIDTDHYALALRWTALDTENQSVAGLLEMNRAKDLDSFKEALRKNYAPMQNVVIADSDGNIAYQVAGIAPKRTLHQGLYGVAPALGWEKQYDWNGYVPFEQLPASQNPEQGWIATANQRIIADNNPNPLTADWDLPARYGNDPKKWSWGQAHIAISEHRPLSKVPFLGSLFNISSPFPGDSNTINVGRLELLRSKNPYETLQGPSLRTIYDLSDLENSLFIYQAGQSGWVQNKLYRNMNPLWANNEYLPMKMKADSSLRTLELSNK